MRRSVQAIGKHQSRAQLFQLAGLWLPVSITGLYGYGSCSGLEPQPTPLRATGCRVRLPCLDMGCWGLQTYLIDGWGMNGTKQRDRQRYQKRTEQEMNSRGYRCSHLCSSGHVAMETGSVGFGSASPAEGRCDAWAWLNGTLKKIVFIHHAGNRKFLAAWPHPQ